MKIEELLEVVKELIKRGLVDPQRSSICGNCIRKAITESSWDYDYDVIHLTGIINLTELPLVRNKFTGIELGHRFKVKNNYYIIQANKSVSFSESLENKRINLQEFLDKKNLEDYKKLNEFKKAAIDKRDYISLVSDEIFQPTELIVLAAGGHYTNEFFTHTLFSFLNHRNFNKVFKYKYSLLVPIGGSFCTKLYETLVEFDKKYSLNYDRVFCRILILCVWGNYDSFSVENFLGYVLKLKNIWKTKFINMKKIFNGIQNHGYLNESSETQARYILRSFKKYSLNEDEDLMDYFLPVYHCYFPLESKEIEKHLLKLKDTDLSIPVNGKDILDVNPYIEKGKIKDIINLAQLMFDKEPSLTKKELMIKLVPYV